MIKGIIVHSEGVHILFVFPDIPCIIRIVYLINMRLYELSDGLPYSMLYLFFYSTYIILYLMLYLRYIELDLIPAVVTTLFYS